MLSMSAIWTIIIVMSIIVEALTINLVSIWFAFGALVALISDQMSVPTHIQIILFTVISVIIIAITRPIAKKYLKGRITKTNLDRAIGKHCLVTETITPDKKGEAKVMGNLWLATSLDNEVIQAGEYGEVVSIEGAHVVLRKI
jgi:membrane protein implicated in regulation of membrane protease activity